MDIGGYTADSSTFVVKKNDPNIEIDQLCTPQGMCYEFWRIDQWTPLSVLTIRRWKVWHSCTVLPSISIPSGSFWGAFHLDTRDCYWAG